MLIRPQPDYIFGCTIEMFVVQPVSFSCFDKILQIFSFKLIRTLSVTI